jgi:poly-gamma-glutamate synthesis protein (capsule biosynthesis protein)
MERPITLAIAGDVMLGRMVNETIARMGPAHPWGDDVLAAVGQADVFLINLECALTARTLEWHDGGEKLFCFRAEPRAGVASLRHAGVGFASLANNHAGDFGTEGLVETLRALDGAGIAHAGAGAGIGQARAPAWLAARGRRIAVVAFADHPAEWAAAAASPGINYIDVSTAPEDFAAVESALAAVRADADIVIFTIHWGPNMRSRPTDAFREFAHKTIDAGADVFWGHSAHIVQGIEFRGRGVILYDTGDFVDDYAVTADLRNDLSALFLVRISASHMVERVELLPVRIDDTRVSVARGRDRAWFLGRLARLCGETGSELVTEEGAETVAVRPAPHAGAGRRR